jgi:hypothetical protein
MQLVSLASKSISRQGFIGSGHTFNQSSANALADGLFATGTYSWQYFALDSLWQINCMGLLCRVDTMDYDIQGGYPDEKACVTVRCKQCAATWTDQYQFVEACFPLIFD